MILDACCGPKEMYRGLHKHFSQEEIVFIDIRKGTYNRDKWGIPPLNVTPDVQADLKKLPFRDGVFNMVIFDPPHGSFTMDAFLGVKYGGLTMREYRTLIVWANREFARVLQPQGLILAKIMEVEDRDLYLERAFHDFKLLLKIKYSSQRAIKTSRAITVWQLYVKRQ